MVINMKNFNKSILASLLFFSCSHFAFAELTESAGKLTGTVPVLKGTGTGTVEHSISFSNGHESGSIDALTPGDTVTLSYIFTDKEGDTDSSATTIKWFTTSDGKDGDKKTLDNDGKATYTITEADAGRYIGAEITELSSTGIPTTGQVITVKDISKNDSADNIPDGPVVGEYIGKMIVDTTAQDVNLIGSSNPLLVGHTYKFRIWYDTNNNNVWDNGELDASANYSYKWVFDGTSATTATAGGNAVSSTDNKDLAIPATNTEATSVFATAGADGVQGYSLKVNYTPLLAHTHQNGLRQSVKHK